MKLFWTWKRPTSYTVVLFLAVGALSALALVWMGIRLVQQDRALETRRLEEQREAAADRIIVALDKALSEQERLLADDSLSRFCPDAEDILLVIMRSGELRVLPENTLLYYPVVPPGREALSSQFEVAERAEFLEKDYGRAIAILHPLSEAEDPATKAGAQLRLARNLRKAGRLEEALEIYSELANSSDQGVSISGVPAELVARRARCFLLEGLESQERLQQEAQSLRNDLKARRWQLDRDSYYYYSGQVAQWIDEDPDSDDGSQAMAEAVEWLWRNRRNIGRADQGGSDRRTFCVQDTPLVVLSRRSSERIAAFIAGPHYQQSQWFEPLFRRSEFRKVSAGIRDPDGAQVYGNTPEAATPVTTRPAFATGLPWDITLISSDLEADVNQFTQRRRFMLIGLGLLALLVMTTSYLIGRAISRELAAARLQSDFVSAVSHEFRTPLTSMRQFTEMLVENERLPEAKRHAYYQAQERATRRLSRLVESLLDFGRMEADARPYRLEPLDIGHLVKSVVEEFKQENDTKNLVIGFRVPKDGPSMNGDRDALAQALWNLLDNAVKYSGKHPAIQVDVEAGSCVAVHVRDKGIGVQPSERRRIFRKFVRGSSADMCGTKGTGIGLAMVKHIVDAHGGRVLVHSEPGKGSTFTIQLPVGGSVDGKNSDR